MAHIFALWHKLANLALPLVMSLVPAPVGAVVRPLVLPGVQGHLMTGDYSTHLDQE